MAPVDVMPLDDVNKNNNGAESDGMMNPAGTSTRRPPSGDVGGGGLSQNRININQYATKKTIAQGMLDIALLTANAAQLKYVLLSDGKHTFYTAMLVLISLSIILQIMAGICQLILITVNLNQNHRLHFADILNNVVTGMVFAITVVNVIISAFGIEDSQITKYPIQKPEDAAASTTP